MANMIDTTKVLKIQVRRDTGKNWYLNNTVLAEGLVGYDTTVGKIKVGDGVTPWNSLSFFALDNLKVSYYTGTTAYWASQLTTPSEANVLYIFTDYKIDEVDGKTIITPGVKLGDGNAYVIDLPFLNSQKELEEHINDTSVHITDAERESWNNKVTILSSIEGENIIFTKD